LLYLRSKNINYYFLTHKLWLCRSRWSTNRTTENHLFYETSLWLTS